mmetsp:Transcript_66045/g.182880  ORF Transcript_66045/g.182880 Transcript_66045/m.182880 type:complete len:113 (+) Transcript_66045:41-379(+)
MVCKQTAMSQFVTSICNAGKALGSVVSIGDSIVEREALKLAVQIWEVNVESSARPLCKTLKLMAEPSLKELSTELQLVVDCLEGVVSHGSDFDLVMDPTEDAQAGLTTHLAP